GDKEAQIQLIACIARLVINLPAKDTPFCGAPLAPSMSFLSLPLSPIIGGCSGGSGKAARMTTAEGELERISARYLRFAADEARGESELYERLALAVAASRELRTFLAGLPADKRQPNLFLAAVRHLRGVPESEHRLVEI